MKIFVQDQGPIPKNRFVIKKEGNMKMDVAKLGSVELKSKYYATK